MSKNLDTLDEQYELIIIGAGPSGISTALHLLQLDSAWRERLLVLEKHHHPRPKLCGGGVTRLGLSILQELGFQFPLPLPHTNIQDITLHYRKKTIHVCGKPQIVIYHRPELDAYLAEEALRRGMQLRQGEAVTNVRIENHGVKITSEKGSYFAQAVVAADGSNSITRRLMRRSGGNHRLARTLENVQPASETETGFQLHRAYFDFTSLSEHLQGYFWNFPSYVGGKPVSNCGVFDARVADKQPKADLRSVLTMGLSAGGKVEPDSWQGFPIHRFSPRSTFSSPRLLLVGDAAGTDPLFGEGIGPALAYGKIAAEVIHDAYLRRDYSFSLYRKKLASSQLGRYLVIRWLAAHVCYRMGHHRLFNEALWILGKWATKLFPPPPPLPEG